MDRLTGSSGAKPVSSGPGCPAKEEGAVSHHLIPGPGRVPGVTKVHALWDKALRLGTEHQARHGDPATGLLVLKVLVPKIQDGSGCSMVEIGGVRVGKEVTQIGTDDDHGVVAPPESLEDFCHLGSLGIADDKRQKPEGSEENL